MVVRKNAGLRHLFGCIFRQFANPNTIQKEHPKRTKEKYKNQRRKEPEAQAGI